MITSKSSRPGDGDRSWANIVHTIVRNPPSQKNLCFITSEVIDGRFSRKENAKRYANVRTPKQSAKPSFQCILHKSAVRPRTALCPAAATAKRATRRDSYGEACCLRIGQANRSRPREKRSSG